MSKDIDAHILDLYAVERLLGSGAYGHVWKVVEKSTNRQLALKKIFDAFQNSTDAQRTYRQITVLNELSHPNIIRLERVLPAKNNRDLYLLFEYMEADLYSIVGEGILTDIHHRFIAYQLFRALKYLHSAHLIHRDLKPSNVLVNSECQVKLCDFGLVRSLKPKTEDQQPILSQEVATRWYRSPQVLLGSQTYSKPADMWSVGCIIAQMLIGHPLFPGTLTFNTGTSTLDQLQKILTFTGYPSGQDINSLENNVAEQLINQASFKKKSIKQVLPSVPEQFIQLITKLVVFNPNKRITAEEALDFPLFEQFRMEFDQVVCSRVIVLPVDDNKRLGLKKYREIIYEEIARRYPSVKMKTEASREKRQEKSRSKGRRQNSSSSQKISKNEKTSKNEQKSIEKSKKYTNVNVLAQKNYNPIKKSIKTKHSVDKIKKIKKDPNLLPFHQLNKLYKYFK